MNDGFSNDDGTADDAVELVVSLADEDATRRFGARLLPLLKPGRVFYLYGDLGAGKTTLVRAALRALGHSDAVKSPTYTLIEPYTINGLRLIHSDLYRIADPDELWFLGLDDMDLQHSVLLVEWPQRGGAALPAADFRLYLEPLSPDHPENGRRCRLLASSAIAKSELKQHFRSIS